MEFYPVGPLPVLVTPHQPRGVVVQTRAIHLVRRLERDPHLERVGQAENRPSPRLRHRIIPHGYMIIILSIIYGKFHLSDDPIRCLKPCRPLQLAGLEVDEAELVERRLVRRRQRHLRLLAQADD